MQVNEQGLKIKNSGKAKAMTSKFDRAAVTEKTKKIHSGFTSAPAIFSVLSRQM